MSMLTKFISVVIANYNYGRFLEEAIQSVISQDGFKQCELIVVDGASTDNSLEIIRKYEENISWWCSERDGGQSNAFNKGFAHAKGRFLTWLNADDVFLPNAFRRLIDAALESPHEEWFAGGVCHFNEIGQVIKCTRARDLSVLRARAADIQVYGPSSFFSRKLFDCVGGYVDERFHYAMDIELWNRFYHRGGVSYRRIPGYVWGFRVHPDSKTTGRELGGSSQMLKNSQAWKRVFKEFDILRHEYDAKPLSKLSRLLSVSLLPKFLSVIDTYKRSGVHYQKLT